MDSPPLLVIVGPTGVGKTAVAVRLASHLPIEAINADSRQVYRGMDIGTGKPTPAEQAALRHHLIDVVGPDEVYHVARFRAEALRAIDEIRARGRLPVLVGGTGLYVRALLKGLHAAPPADPGLRRELEAVAAAHGPAALRGRLETLDPARAAALHPNDRVRLVRASRWPPRGAAAAAAAPWADAVPPFRLVMIGLALSRDALNTRLAARVRGMVADGMMDEVARLRAAGYADSLPAMGGIGYRQLAAAADGRMPMDEAIRLMIRDTTRYAKRQMTWFARDPEIRWLDMEAVGGVEGATRAVLAEVRKEELDR